MFERVNAVCARCVPTGKTNVPALYSAGLRQRDEVVFSKLTCALFVHCCTMLPVVQHAYATSNTSRHTLPVSLDQHTASPIRMFMASSHNLNRMSESWFHSLPSSFLFSFIPTSSYSLFLTLQLFCGIFPLFLSFSI